MEKEYAKESTLVVGNRKAIRIWAPKFFKRPQRLSCTEDFQMVPSMHASMGIKRVILFADSLHEVNDSNEIIKELPMYCYNYGLPLIIVGSKIQNAWTKAANTTTPEGAEVFRKWLAGGCDKGYNNLVGFYIDPFVKCTSCKNNAECKTWKDKEGRKLITQEIQNHLAYPDRRKKIFTLGKWTFIA